MDRFSRYRGEARLQAVRFASAFLLGALACQDSRPTPQLEPELLFDQADLAAFVAEFPTERYEVAVVPALGRFYVDDNPALVKKWLREGRVWEPYVIAQLEEHLAPGDVVLDVGAHIGALTVAMARRVGEAGTVYAFEPQRKIYRELIHNLALNALTNVVPLRFALSAESGLLEMDAGDGMDGQVSIGRGGDVVEARTLDSFGFPSVALIKIDVEGHEVEVLHGAGKLIESFHPVIIIETLAPNRDTVLRMLADYGYTVRSLTRWDYIATYGRDAQRELPSD